VIKMVCDSCQADGRQGCGGAFQAPLKYSRCCLTEAEILPFVGVRAGTFEGAASASQLQPAAEAKLSAPLPPLQQHQQPALHFAVSVCLWGCLQRTLAPTVFLQQLGDKFARLMTQLLVRYDTWLQEVVRIRQQPPPPPVSAAAPAALQQPPGQPPLQQPPGSSTGPGTVAEARSGQAAWVPDMPLDSAAVICADADMLKVSPLVPGCAS
jgi:hypothetical protein